MREVLSFAGSYRSREPGFPADPREQGGAQTKSDNRKEPEREADAFLV